MKILLIAGHGDGDPGAIGNNYKESDLTRDFITGLAKLLKMDFEIYPFTKNCYKESMNGNTPKYSNYDYVLEIHFNAFNSKKTGVELYKHINTDPKPLEEKIVKAISSHTLNNRGIKFFDNLHNMRKCYESKTPYALLETCFIDNKTDMEKYQKNKTEIIKNIAEILNKEFYKETTIYRVQIGAFTNKINAVNLQSELKKKGFSAIIKSETK